MCVVPLINRQAKRPRSEVCSKGARASRGLGARSLATGCAGAGVSETVTWVGSITEKAKAGSFFTNLTNACVRKLRQRGCLGSGGTPPPEKSRIGPQCWGEAARTWRCRRWVDPPRSRQAVFGQQYVAKPARSGEAVRGLPAGLRCTSCQRVRMPASKARLGMIWHSPDRMRKLEPDGITIAIVSIISVIGAV